MKVIDEHGNYIASFRTLSKCDAVAHRESIKRQCLVSVEDAKGNTILTYKPKGN